jgi:hypothetical protein
MALLLIVWAATVHAGSPLVIPDGGVLIPDSAGRISELLLSYDPELAGELEPLYRDLFAQLGPRVHVRVICPYPADGLAFAQRWQPAATADERTVEVVAVGMPVTIWSRDRCIARQSRSLRQRANVFVPAHSQEYYGEQHNDRMVHGLLSLAGLLPGLYSSPLHLEGGNVVSNRRHAFIGANVLIENTDLRRARTLRPELRRLLGKPHLLVGDGGVPWCHVDMYLTPLGDRTVLVASTTLGNQLLRDAAQAGDPRAVRWLCEIDESPATAERFDGVARQVTSRGYRVTRVPALVHDLGDWMVTYNNVLLDERDGARHALVPHYGVALLDDAGQAAYAAQGFHTAGVDVSRIYTFGGALRCVANVTARVPSRQRMTASAIAPGGRITFINLAADQLLDQAECQEPGAPDTDESTDIDAPRDAANAVRGAEAPRFVSTRAPQRRPSSGQREATRQPTTAPSR